MAIKKSTQRVNNAVSQNNLVSVALVEALDLQDKINPSMSVKEVAEQLSDALITSGEIIIDSELSTTSKNPVQNKVITTELNKKLEKVEATDVDSGEATSGQVLTANGEGGASWVDSSSGDVEGTDILSTGETSGKVLSANGDGTSSWVSPAPSGIEEINLKDLGNWHEASLISVGGNATFMGTMTDDVVATLRNGYVASFKIEFSLYKNIVMYKQPITDDNNVYYVGRAVDYTSTSEGGRLDDVFILRAVVGGNNKFMSIVHYANTLDLGTITAIPQGTGANNINRANNMNNILYNPELNIQFNFTGNSKNFWVTAKKQLVDYTTKTAYFVVPNWYKYTLGQTSTNTSDLHVSISVASGTYCDIRFNLYSDGIQEVKLSNINSESAPAGQVMASNGSGGAQWETKVSSIDGKSGAITFANNIVHNLPEFVVDNDNAIQRNLHIYQHNISIINDSINTYINFSFLSLSGEAITDGATLTSTINSWLGASANGEGIMVNGAIKVGATDHRYVIALRGQSSSATSLNFVTIQSTGSTSTQTLESSSMTNVVDKVSFII